MSKKANLADGHGPAGGEVPDKLVFPPAAADDAISHFHPFCVFLRIFHAMRRLVVPLGSAELPPELW
ncbi:MAG: hypothetical protein P4M00_15040 [Azospirillaceae bacterium]|nr:hypothetical protein [Azospirillaceae bacterium]